MQSRLLRGTFILSGAIFFSKFLGMIFMIPFHAIVGTEGVALYSYAYVPYQIILSAATLGIPMAVSKFVSKYNTAGDYLTGRRLFRSGIFVMMVTGVLAFLLLYWLAPFIAPHVVSANDKAGNSPADVTMVIRLVGMALLVVPVMSLIRGYFQGFQSMGPTAVSQVVEQIVRIAFILIGASVVIYGFHGSISTAVGFATFAAFVGALGGLFVLIRYWLQRKDFLNQQLRDSQVKANIPLSDIYRELIAYAIPFVVVGLAIPLYQLVDQFTINDTLRGIGFEKVDAEAVYANITQLSHKLIMIPVSLATGLTVTLVPTITNSFTSGKFRTLHNQITQGFQMVLFLTIPAAVGLSVLAYSVYNTLYPDTIEALELGGQILRWYAPTALLFAFFSITASILQGINQQKFAVLSLLVGVLLKLSLNEWLLTVFHGLGAILATDIGFIFSVVMNVLVVRHFAGYRLRFILKRALLILIFAAVMAVIVYGVTWLFGGSSAAPKSYGRALLTTVVGVLVGGGCYFWLALRSNLAAQIFGDRFKFLQRR